jgi:hypothetical protein
MLIWHADHEHSHANSHGSEADAPKLVDDLSANALGFSRDEREPLLGPMPLRFSSGRSEPDLSGEAL